MRQISHGIPGSALKIVLATLMALQWLVSVDALAQDEPDLRIYTVEGTRGYRIIWLAEELGIPYQAVFERGNKEGSYDLIRQVNPLMPQSPTVVYKGTMMVESGGIIAYLMSQHSDGRLQPDPDSEEYFDYLLWLHFAEGSALPVLFGEARGGRYAGIQANADRAFVPNAPVVGLVGTQRAMAFIEAHLEKYPYFGGSEFSAADIMMHFVAELAPDPNYFALDLSSYPNFAAWEKRVEQRPAYQRAMAVALPDNQECPRLPGCAPVTAGN